MHYVILLSDVTPPVRAGDGAFNLGRSVSIHR